MTDERLPLEWGEDPGRPAAAEAVPAADRLAAMDERELRERMDAAAAEKERKAERSQEIQRANLRPREAPIRHGVHARIGVYMLCARCPVRELCDEHDPDGYCRREETYLQQRTRQILQTEWIDPERDGPTVRELVWCEIRLERAKQYIAIKGEFEGGQYLPVAKGVAAIQNTWGRLLEKLALTPPSAKAMAESGQGGLGDLAAALLGGRDRIIDATAPDEVVEGEFTATDESGTGVPPVNDGLASTGETPVNDGLASTGETPVPRNGGDDDGFA